MTVSIDTFDYALPNSFIAQHPRPGREEDRLLRIERDSGTISHHRFLDLPDFLRRGDCVVVNDTRVIPSRIKGRKQTGGAVELLLLHKLDQESRQWHCMAKRTNRMKPGMAFTFDEGLSGEVAAVYEGGTIDILFSQPVTEETLFRIGELPLPPYIHRPEGPETTDYQRYQTVFARVPGAVAAPTAGLHFSPDLVKKIEEKGIKVISITLHVGSGTFLPLRVSQIEDHKMHREYYEISGNAAAVINQTKTAGGRIVAIGTTVVRTLESAADAAGHIQPGAAWTALFIYPPYRFRVVDVLVTNFHLPKSTLLLLVCSFASKDMVFKSYETAKETGYRFYSYGDAMLID